MNLSEKLRAYMGKKVSNQENHCSSLENDISNLKSARDFSRDNDAAQICDVLKAQTINTPFGVHLVAINTYNFSFYHAGTPLSSIFKISPEIISLIAKDTSYQNLDFRKSVFIDTETTGLAGGSGTYAFLVGVGFFEKDKFKLLQYFMKDYDQEPAILYSLNLLMKQFESIVSFNGKAYDIPLLSTRFLINRMENPLEKPFHLDLLASARRIYKERFSSVSLSSLETNLFYMQRKGDIPSFEIPSIYFRFLRDKNPYPLKPIFYHNRMDILSLVTLVIKMADALKNPLGSDGCSDQDFYCLARIYEDMGMFDESIKCYQKALDVPDVREKAYFRLSLLYKRLGHWGEALKLWNHMAENNINATFALVELAKLYEHIAKDYSKAEQATRKALELTYRKKSLLGRCNEGEIGELKKRMERIKQKKGKQQGQVKINDI